MSITPAQAVTQFLIDQAVAHGIIQGPATGGASVVATESGNVPTLASVLATIAANGAAAVVGMTGGSLLWNASGVGSGISPLFAFDGLTAATLAMRLNSTHANGGYATIQCSGANVLYMGSAKATLGLSLNSGSIVSPISDLVLGVATAAVLIASNSTVTVDLTRTVNTGASIFIVNSNSSQTSVAITATSAFGANAANATMFVGKDGVTSRSINAGGTINASGADYADYYTKAAGCGTIAKGRLAGIDADGHLTDTWAAAKNFKWKSTAPNLCGGDMWGSEEMLGTAKPVEPKAPIEPTAPAALADDATDADRDLHDQMTASYSVAAAAYPAAKAIYDAEVEIYTPLKAAFDAVLEAARQKVDRMACSGKIPAVISGTPAAGDLVIAAQDGTGIKAVAVALADATFDQFKAQVGRVLVADPDAAHYHALLGPDFAIDPAWNAIVDV